MRLSPVLAAALTVAMAGCLSQPSEEPVDAPGALVVPWSVAYACGPGHDLPLPDGGCHGRLEGGPFTFGEPQVALHPTDPTTFAIGVSDGRRPDGFDPGSPAAEPRGLAVYVTRDGGTTFARHAIDVQAIAAEALDPAAMGADPALDFATDGSLHFAGLIITGSAGTPSNPVSLETTLFTQRSPDLASWDAPVVVTATRSNDREWLETSAEDEVVLTWRDHTRGLSVFARGAGGIADSAEPIELEGCGQVSNAAWVHGVAVVACQVGNDLTIFELGSPPIARGTAKGACPTNSARLTSTPQGALVASCYYGTMATSLDGGWTWSDTFDVFERLQVDDDWPGTPSIFAMRSDPSGMVHLSLSNFRGQQVGSLQAGRPVAHAVLDPVADGFVHQVELQRGADGGSPTGIGWADDFYAIDFVGDRGILVWTSSDWSTHFVVLDVPTEG